MSTHDMFLWRNKKNITTFILEKKKKYFIKSYELTTLFH